MVLPDEELEKFILSKVDPYPKKAAFGNLCNVRSGPAQTLWEYIKLAS